MDITRVWFYNPSQQMPQWKRVNLCEEREGLCLHNDPKVYASDLESVYRDLAAVKMMISR